MTGLVLAPAGGLTREVLTIVDQVDGYDDLILLDDDPRLWGIEIGGTVVLGPIDLVVERPRHDLLVCAGAGAVRRRIVTRWAGHGIDPERYTTMVHPAVEVPVSCSVGAGTVVLAGTVFTADVRVGRHVVVMPQVTFTHDDEVADYATLCAGTTLGGGVRIGEGAFVGMNSSVREHVTVGAHATVGMGTVVLHDIPAAETWAGVPAHRLRAPGAPADRPSPPLEE